MRIALRVGVLVLVVGAVATALNLRGSAPSAPSAVEAAAPAAVSAPAAAKRPAAPRLAPAEPEPVIAARSAAAPSQPAPAQAPGVGSAGNDRGAETYGDDVDLEATVAATEAALQATKLIEAAQKAKEGTR